MKYVHLEDVKVGQYVIVERKTESWSNKVPEILGNGPGEVLAVELPYIAIQCGHQRWMLDTRRIRIKAASKKFYEAIFENPPPSERPKRSRCKHCKKLLVFEDGIVTGIGGGLLDSMGPFAKGQHVLKCPKCRRVQ